MPKLFLYFFIAFFSLAIFSNESSINYLNDDYSHSVYGGIGLIQTPTSRFSNDGEFTFGLSTDGPYKRLYSKAQFFPWLEAVLRYTEGEFLPYNPGSLQTWKDKGLDMKIRLIEESEAMPSLAFGLLDLGGTGAYSSEYLVSSKRMKNIDLTVGIGWGRLGGIDHLDNPLAWVDENRKIRGGFKDRGGRISLDRFFSGKNVSFFGGIEYFSPIENLSFKIEYDTSDYSEVEGLESNVFKTGDIFKVDSRVNYAINLKRQLTQREWVDFAIGFVRGNTISANFSIHSNLNYSGIAKTIIGGEKIRNTNLPGGEDFEGLDQNRKNFLKNRTIKELANIGFVTHRIIYNGNELAAELSQSRFLETSMFIDLASRVLANNSPKNIDTITVINIDNGIETYRTSVKRTELVESVRYGPLDEELLVFNSHHTSEKAPIILENEILYPNFYWSVRPNLNYTIQHQEKFFFWQLEALIHTEYSIRKGLYLTTDIGIDVDNNFEAYTYHIPDGELYNVRQDRRLYLTEGKNGIRKMSFDYLVDINQNIKAKASFGYLEWMYGGVGGEVIYVPDSKRWGLGIDAYWVKQREYNQRFSFKDYETFTGFLSYYQDIPFYDMRLKISAGRFLGKDKGAMIDISRRFDTGARIGGFVVLSDCDAQCVGEGSFHKGIYFELPMDLFYVQSTTRQKTGYLWSPLTKNAGARLETGSLYELVTDATDEIKTIQQKPWSIRKILFGFGTQAKEAK